jgi:hypothetical protein
MAKEVFEDIPVSDAVALDSRSLRRYCHYEVCESAQFGSVNRRTCGGETAGAGRAGRSAAYSERGCDPLAVPIFVFVYICKLDSSVGVWRPSTSTNTRWVAALYETDDLKSVAT